MTHSDIQQNEIIDRYILGRLSDEERSSFEEHLSDCPACLDRVETLECFRRGLRAVITEDAARGVVLSQAGLLAWLTRLSRRGRSVLFVALLLIIALLPTLVYVMEVRKTARELDQVRSVAADLRHNYSELQRSVRRLQEQLRASEEDRLRVEAQLARDRQTHIDAQLLPPASMLLFTLNRVRDPEIDQSSPANKVAISKSSQWLILMLEIEPDPEVAFYRSTIFNGQKHAVWDASNLKLSDADTIAIVANGNLFKPGNYVVKLQGCTRSRHCYPAATYSFQVTVMNR